MRRRPATRVNNVPLSASSCRGCTLQAGSAVRTPNVSTCDHKRNGDASGLQWSDSRTQV